ncbi:MAG: 4a-hydroxytetrahydrobiopterin dehydratase [Candidatus Magasanikbacteria bacterium]
MDLESKSCTPCEEGGEPMEEEEIQDFIDEVNPDWHLRKDKKIFREFDFTDFEEALEFVNEVGDLAEEEGHHPDIHIRNYNEVVVELWTHAVGGLTENDFIMAKKIDQI